MRVHATFRSYHAVVEPPAVSQLGHVVFFPHLQVAKALASMITICWKETPSSRLTALRLAKNLAAERQKVVLRANGMRGASLSASSGYSSPNTASSERWNRIFQPLNVCETSL